MLIRSPSVRLRLTWGLFRNSYVNAHDRHPQLVEHNSLVFFHDTTLEIEAVVVHNVDEL